MLLNAPVYSGYIKDSFINVLVGFVALTQSVLKQQSGVHMNTESDIIPPVHAGD